MASSSSRLHARPALSSRLLPLFAALLLACCILSARAATGADQSVLTYHDNNARTGLNDHETALKPSNVNSSHFGLIRVMRVDGKVNAEPLYLSNVTIDGARHNVVYAATENDSVYAFDADSGRQLWKISILANNEKPSGNHGCGQITPEIGITATPVIDRSHGPHGAIFVVGMSEDAGGAYHHRLHALDLTTGAEIANRPTEIRASYPGTGAGSSGGTVHFDPGQYAERVGMLLFNGTIYTGWTSHCDQDPYTGWLMAYSESTLQQTGVLNFTPNGSEGAIWMSGAGLAGDAQGNIYFLDGNGSFDTTLNAQGFPKNGDFGNGFIKVSTAGGKLSVADYFEPYNTIEESKTDLDLGSGGTLLLPDLTDASGKTVHLAVGAGKDGNIYLVNRDDMGKFNPNHNDIDQEIKGALHRVYSMPAYFNHILYYGSISGRLKAYPMHDAKLAGTPSAQTANTFAYPGATPSISADGTSNGIVWAVQNASPAVLYAFDAGSLKELYDSNQAPSGRDHFGEGNKFITPLIVKGKVFVGTRNGVAEFGLLH
jgi:outer membrane protein assembly factor BamB